MLPWIVLSPALAGPALPPPPPCKTMELLPSAPPVRKGAVARAAGGTKSLRDVWNVPNQRTSRDFVVRWGNSGGVSTASVDALLASFQVAWEKQIEEMEHPQPYGSDAYRFNVYLGDTGNGTPSGYGSGGYYWVDDDGWPMIVVSAATLADPEFTEHTAAHEFYHAIQGATERYAYEGISAWYWEATAEWASLQTIPENTSNGTFVYGYLLLTELPVNFFDYPDMGQLQEYHQYGAFLFPHDLTAQVGWELVRDSWTDRGTEPDPMEVLRSELADRGEDLDELWLDHLGHVPVMDVPQGDLFQSHMDIYGSWFGDEAMLQDTVSGDGGEGASRGDRAPMRYGAVMLRLKKPTPGDLTVTVTGDRQGTEGSRARFGGRVVREAKDGTITYTPIVFDGVDGTAEVEGLVESDDVHVTIGAWTEDPATWETERFPLEWSMVVTPADPEDPAPDDPRPGPGTAGEEVLTCDQGRAGPLAGMLLALPLLALRRRTR